MKKKLLLSDKCCGQHFITHAGQKQAADWNAIYVETALPSGNLPTKVWILQKGVSA